MQTRPHADTALLDELLAAEDFWIHRTEEAKNVAEHILSSSSGVVVLYGSAHSGKSEMIMRSVRPLLAETHRVFVMKSAQPFAVEGPDGLPVDSWEALALGDIVIIDNFEEFFALPDSPRNEIIARLTQWLARRRSGVLVLVIKDSFLSRMFSLSGSVPQILEESYELHAISFKGAAEPIQRVSGRYGLSLGPGLLDKVILDLEQIGPKSNLSPSVLAILTFEFFRTNLDTPDRPFTIADLQAKGGVFGLLESHIDFMLDTLPTISETDLARAVLEEVAIAGSKPADLDCAANRYDASQETLSAVLKWLESERRILQRSSGRYEFVVPQFIPIFTAKVDRELRANEQTQWILRQGLRSFFDIDSLLPEHIFKKIHFERSTIRVNEEEAKFLLRCSLVYQEAGSLAVVEHWLRRVTRVDTRVDQLFSALFDSRPPVRQRAVHFLAGCERPEVRNQLHLLALRDPSEDVRREAVGALSATKDEQLRQSLLQEIDDRNSPYRLAAMDALEIFKDLSTVDKLSRLVGSSDSGDSPVIRAKAIEVLGRLETPAAVDRLLEIRLHDADREDRQKAAATLCLQHDESLLRHLMEKMRDARTIRPAKDPLKEEQSVFSRILPALAAIAATVVDVVVHGFLLFTLRRLYWGCAVLITELVALGLISAFPQGSTPWSRGLVLWFASWFVGEAVAAHTVFAERYDRRQKQTAYRRSLGHSLFWLNALTWALFVHGLLNILTRRVWRGVALLGFELLGIFLIVTYIFLQETIDLFSKISPFFSFLGGAFLLTGLFLMVVSYIVDVARVVFDTLIFSKSRETGRRLNSLYRELMGNPLAIQIVFHQFQSSDPATSRGAAKRLRKVLPQVEEELAALLPHAQLSSKRKIVTLLARRCSEFSLKTLRSAIPDVGWRARVRSLQVACLLPFAAWRTSLLLLVALVVTTLVAFTFAGYEHYENQPHQIGLALQDASQAKDAIKKLVLIAAEFPEQLSQMADKELVLAVENSGLSVEIRKEVVASIVAASRTELQKRSAVEKITGFLKSPEQEAELVSAGLDGLGEIGTDFAIARLREFAELSTSAPRLRENAILALGRMRLTSSLPRDVLSEAFETLDLLKSNRLLPTRLQEVAKTQAEGFAPEFYRAQQVRAQLAVAASQLDAKHYDEAKATLLKALSDPEEEKSIEAAINLTLNLAVAYHDELNKPRDCYEILTALSKLGPKLKRSADIVNANLVEASLTVGEYDRSLKLGQELLAQETLDRETKLNVQALVYLGLLFQNRLEEAAEHFKKLSEYRKSLPPEFENNWYYDGTRAYVNRSSLSESLKTKGLQALDLVEGKS